MVSVSHESAAAYEIKRSKFLSFLLPFDAYEARLETLRSLHPKARHFVSASRRINEYDQIEEHFSDDGEPKGVAGMPTLKVLQGADIVNAAIITVRYFGGIKLGTGGMARAYADAANLAVLAAGTTPYIKPFRSELPIAYNELSRLEHACSGLDDVTIEACRYETFGVTAVLCGRESSVQMLLEMFQTP